MFDPVMSMSYQVNSICSSTNYHLRNIARIRKNIDRDTCHHVVRCLVTSRLDYCNSLLYGITKAHLKRLTGIQYRAAKLVLAVNCWRAHGSPLLAQLHWLPIEKRIQFKTLLYVFKCLNDIAPPYLSDMFIFTKATVKDSVLPPIELGLPLTSPDYLMANMPSHALLLNFGTVSPLLSVILLV